MKKKTKKSKHRYIYIFLAVLVISSAFYFGLQGTLAFPEGWGIGIWNNTSGYLGAVEQFAGPATGGWLKSSSGLSGPCSAGASYSIYFSSGSLGDALRNVSGKAWFGVGSAGNFPANSEATCQGDLPSLGWLDFGAGSPASCPGDCHAAQWNQQPGGGYTGYLDGWAKITSMGDNGWVRLKGSNYGTLSDSNGVLSGFSWNSGTENAIIGNSGLGWIKMDGLKIVECGLSSCATKQLCTGSTFSSCDASFCAGTGSSCTLNSGTSWTCNGGCGSPVSCGNTNIAWIDKEVGACGSLNGGSICDPAQTPTNDKLCANGTTPHNFSRSGITATWTCGSNQCGGSESPTCSASTRCGWIETNP